MCSVPVFKNAASRTNTIFLLKLPEIGDQQFLLL